MSNTELNNRTLSIERTFQAPIELVWEAWTQPEHIAQWWGPKGMETRVIEHNFEEGGEWKYAMDMPNGGEFISEGVYKTITKLTEIYTTAEFKPMTTGVEIQALFEGDGNQTRFTFNCIHPTEAYKKQQEEMGFFKGWGSTFDRLEKFLKQKSN